MTVPVDGEEASTSTRYNESSRNSGFADDPPEEIINVLAGKCSRWHIIVLCVFSVSMLVYGLNVFAMPLLHPVNIKFNCTDSTPAQNELSPCYTTEGKECTNFNFFETKKGYTITEKYKLVCDDGLRVAIIHCLFKCGLIVGFILFGIVSDLCGRKNLWAITIICQLCVAVLLSANANYYFYTACRGFHGIFLAGNLLITTVLTCDFSSNRFRTFNIGLIMVSISMGHIAVPYIWAEISENSKAILILSCLLIIDLFLVKFVRESPNWLLRKNKTVLAENVLVSVARWNGMETSNFRIRPIQITYVTSKGPIGLINMIQAVTTRNMVLALYVIWLAMCIMHTFNYSSNLTTFRDEIISIETTGFLSLGAAALSVGMCYILKHKISIILASLLSCSTSVAAYVINNKKDTGNDHIILILTLSSYGASSLLIFTVFNLTPRVFPTELRCRGTAVAFAIGEAIDTVSNLFLIYTNYLSLITLSAVMASCTFCILLAVNLLYTTHNRELPDMLEDSMQFNYHYKPMRWTTIRAASPTLDEVAVKVIDFEKGTSISMPYKNEKVKKNTANKGTQK